MFLRLGFRAVVTLALFAAPLCAAKEEGVAADVKFIRCQTCEFLVGALHSQVKASKKRLGESEVHSMVEKVCKHAETEGAWLRSLDMVEDGRQIRLERQPHDGPCGKECLTISLACEKLLEEGWENELGEGLWEGTMRADQLSKVSCNEWSSACRRPAPSTPASRQKGPPFRAFSDEERATFSGGEQRRAGVLSRAQLRHRLGLAADEPEKSVANDEMLNLGVEDQPPDTIQSLVDSGAFVSHRL